MMVIYRTAVTIVVMIHWSGCVVMILAAGMYRLGADRGPAEISSEDASIEPGQRANHHQPCKKQSHHLSYTQ